MRDGCAGGIRCALGGCAATLQGRATCTAVTAQPARCTDLARQLGGMCAVSFESIGCAYFKVHGNGSDDIVPFSEHSSKSAQDLFISSSETSLECVCEVGRLAPTRAGCLFPELVPGAGRELAFGCFTRDPQWKQRRVPRARCLGT